MKPAGKHPSRVSNPCIVDFHVRSGTGKAGRSRGGPTFEVSTLVRLIRAGLPVSELEALRTGLDMPLETLACKLGISRATLHRRRASGRLDPEESDRVVRFARLLGKAIEVFESAENAQRWLRSPQLGLGGEVPLDYAESEVGAREVEDLLGRIEFGVYS
jgi:putative toxin-antitoxin system antitoxin component (TIGR02293 family)